MDRIKFKSRENHERDRNRRQPLQSVDAELEAEAYEDLMQKRSPGDGKHIPRRRGKRP